MKTTSEKLRPQLIRIFDHLHEHPEPSWKEHATTEYIRGILEQLGCRTTAAMSNGEES